MDYSEYGLKNKPIFLKKYMRNRNCWQTKFLWIWQENLKTSGLLNMSVTCKCFKEKALSNALGDLLWVFTIKLWYTGQNK